MFKPYHQSNNDNQEADSQEAEGMFDILDAAGERKVEPAAHASEQAVDAGEGQSAADQVDFDGALKHADIKPLDVSAPEPAGVESVDFSAVLKPVSVAQAVANTTTPVAGNSAAAAQPAVVAAAAAASPEGLVTSAAPAVTGTEHLAGVAAAGIAAQPLQPAAAGEPNQPVVQTKDFAFPAPDAASATNVPAADSSIKFDQTEKPVAVASNATAAPIEFDQTKKAAHEVVPEIAKPASEPVEASVPEKPAVETVSFEAAEKSEAAEKPAAPVTPVVPDAPAVPAVPAVPVVPATSTVSATPATPHVAAPAAQPVAVAQPSVATPAAKTEPAAVPAAAAPVAHAVAHEPAPVAVAAVAPVAPVAPAATKPVAKAAAVPSVASAADGHSATSGKVADKNVKKAKGSKKKNDDEEFGRSGMLSAVHHSTAWTVFFAILSLLWIYPIVLVFINSFKKKQFITGSATFELPNAESWTSFDNYTRGVQQTNLFASFGWTVFITVGAVALILVCTSMCAWWIVRVNNLFAKIIYMLFLFNMIVPFQMVMYPLSKLANMMGLDTPWGLWVIYLGFGAGLSVFMFTGVIKGLPSEIEESAMIDGASVPQTFFGIVWPMMKPSMVSVAILQTMWIWNDYLLPYLILDMKKYKTMSIAVQYLKGGFGSIDMGAMMGCLVLAMLPIIIFYLVCQKYIIAGVTAGAVKG
ncbi:ABC-type glycerol-3-phosphate transport system permease component [Pseudoscardovia suis]|uniref:Sugar ABC transporter, permease n=2 Tax=Pseudoscardovia suis TaxID=987063 RepID=A0A261EWM3_9BIFI|nr:sugar ABC transporter, permease [Pseudoscardovia suis]PJJ62646.1 ABC-type glycerol-3-phosphate transport system permease component [Pseudoscardovia suis]